MKVLLDAHGGVIKTFHDVGNDNYVIESVQDVEPILNDNKRQQHTDGYTPSRDMRKIASIPLVVIQQWSKEDGVNYLSLDKKEFARIVRRKLRDPANRFFRTSRGAL